VEFFQNRGVKNSELRILNEKRRRLVYSVNNKKNWIPAFAGMTNGGKQY
jgi:hypothetical protein